MKIRRSYGTFVYSITVDVEPHLNVREIMPIIKYIDKDYYERIKDELKQYGNLITPQELELELDRMRLENVYHTFIQSISVAGYEARIKFQCNKNRKG